MMIKSIGRLMADEGGASFTEYAVLVSVVGAAVVVAGGVFAGGMNRMFTNLTNLMTGWVT
jgi:Flp pilus assembly pilin Flp